MVIRFLKVQVIVALIGMTQYFAALGAEDIEGKWSKPGIPHRGWMSYPQKLVMAHNQAAIVALAMTSYPLQNLTPVMTFDNYFLPPRGRQVFSAGVIRLNTMKRCFPG